MFIQTRVKDRSVRRFKHSEGRMKMAQFTIKASTVVWCCVIGAVILGVLYFVGVTLYQGSLMK